MGHKPIHKSDTISIKPPACPESPEYALHLELRRAFERASSPPPVPKPRATEFNNVVSSIRNLLDDFYTHLRKMKGRTLKITALIKDFANKALLISGIDGDEAEDTSRWAKRECSPGQPYKREDEERFYFVGALLLDKLSRAARMLANDNEHFFALQNIFDDVMKHKDARFLLLILTFMDRIPQEDTGMMKDNMGRYADMQRAISNSVPLPKFLAGDFDPSRPMERVVLHEIDNAVYHPDGAKQADSRRWLISIGFDKGEIDENLPSKLRTGSR